MIKFHLMRLEWFSKLRDMIQLKKSILFFAIFAVFQFAIAQTQVNPVKDSTVTNQLQTIEEVIIKTNQIKQSSTNNTVVGKAELLLGNSGRDIPILLQQLPNVITTSDAGDYWA